MEPSKTKASIAYDYLLKLIDSDEYQPGDKLPTEMALSEKLNINRLTIAKAFAALKSEGYVDRVTKRGTTLLRKPSEGLCKTVLLISPWQDWNTHGMWYYRTLSYAIQVEAMQSDHTLINTTIHAFETDTKEIEKIRTLHYTNNCSGVIIIDPFTSTRDEVQALLDQLKCPAVWAGSGLGPDKSSHCVDVNNLETAKELTNRLIGDGAKRILFISGALDTLARQRRFDGYRAALEENNIPLRDELVICHESHRLDMAGSECAALYAARRTEADAIFLNDFQMIEGIHTFCNLYPGPQLDNLKSLPIATFDYEGKSDEPNIHYSAVQPVEEIGKQAVRLLLQVEKEKPAKALTKTLPAEIREF